MSRPAWRIAATAAADPPETVVVVTSGRITRGDIMSLAAELTREHHLPPRDVQQFITYVTRRLREASNREKVLWIGAGPRITITVTTLEVH